MDRPGARQSTWVRPWLIALAVGFLTACQSMPPSTAAAGNDPAPVAASWRVVERLGQARYLSAGMAGWQEVVVGSILPAGSQITTGIGGRLILAQDSSQMIAGTSSRFILPGWQPGDHVRQTSGWMRYRIAGARAGSFEIETPFLDLAVADAVLDVTVADSETEVAVVSGRVHVKTLDDRRQIDLKAGYVGYASLDGHPLALRRGPGATLEPVPLSVIPALHPERPGNAHAAGSPAIEPAHQDLSLEQASDERADRPRGPHGRQAGAIGAATEPPVALAQAGDAPPPAAQRSLSSRPAPLAATAPAMAGTTTSPSARRDAGPAMILASMAAAEAAPDLVGGPGDGLAVAPAGSVGTDPGEGAAVPEETEAPADRVLRSASASSQPATPSDGAAIESREQLRQRFDLLTEGLLDGVEPVRPMVPGATR